MTVKTLGQRYQIKKQLGQHAGRQTVLALNLQMQELVVIKVLSLGVGFDWQDLKLFEREAETLKRLSHPSIPRYLDYLEFERQFALVQTYVQGKTLEQYLKAGRTFGEAAVKELAKSLLEILVYLHQQNPPVIHRDIKPSNILLGDRTGNSVGRVYLVDFGSVAHLTAQKGGTITVVGTYGYMPPEQFGGRATPTSDLYSLGATLIYLISGLHPTEIPQKELRLEFRQLVNIDESFADWLSWMTEPSLELRLGSAKEALKALEMPRDRLQYRPRDRPIAFPRVSQPIGSAVTLRKTEEFIEILFPAEGVEFGAIGVLLAVQFLCIGVLLGGFFIAIFLFHGLTIFALAPVIVFVLALIVIRFCFRRIGWYIDSKAAYSIQELFGGRKLSFFPKDSIVRAELTNFKGSETALERLADAMDAKKKIAKLTQKERVWLATELADWLQKHNT